MTTPTHGDTRNRGRHQLTRTFAGRHMATGEPIEATYVSADLPTAERYCEHCAAWVRCTGLLAFVMTPCCGVRW